MTYDELPVSALPALLNGYLTFCWSQNLTKIAKAVARATDLENLARLRAGLRRQVLASPLFAGPRFARNFEAAMWEMWLIFQAER